MDHLETLLDRGGGENHLTEELTKLYGGSLAFERRSEARPFVVVNFVMTIEGLTSYGISGKAGGGWISGFNKQDVFIMGLLRSFADGVAVGANTLRSEPEHLWTSKFIDEDHETEFVELRKALGKAKTNPVQIFVTSSGNVLDKMQNLPRCFRLRMSRLSPSRQKKEKMLLKRNSTNSALSLASLLRRRSTSQMK